jgi:hypothetical protein
VPDSLGFLAMLRVFQQRLRADPAESCRKLTIVAFAAFGSILTELIQAPGQIHIPMLDLGLFHFPNFYPACLVLLILSLMLMLDKRRALFGGFLAFLLSALLVIGSANRHRQFGFLPPFVFLAISLVALFPEDRFGWRRMIWATLTASIYGFAAFHKAINFNLMLVSLPTKLLEFGGNALAQFCGDGSCAPLLQVTAWSAIPLDITLAVLSLTNRWIRPRLLLVIVFHWLSSCGAFPIVYNVSEMMLVVQLNLCCVQVPSTAQKLFLNRKWRSWVVFEGFWIGLALVARILFPNNSSSELFGRICYTTLMEAPIWFLLFPFLRPEAAAPTEPVFEANYEHLVHRVAMPAVTGFLILNLVFGFSPLLLSIPYSVPGLGWNVFSGASRYRFSMKAPFSPCFDVGRMDSVISKNSKGAFLIFRACRQQDLEYLRNFLITKRKCVGAEQLEIKFRNRVSVSAGTF